MLNPGLHKPLTGLLTDCTDFSILSDDESLVKIFFQYFVSKYVLKLKHCLCSYDITFVFC